MSYRLRWLDGYQVAEKLRSTVPGKLWVAAISGYKQDAERDVASKLFDHYFVKPVNFDELRRALPVLSVSVAPDE